MLGYLDFLFLSYSGRIGRLPYWFGYFVLGVLQLVVIFGLLKLSNGTLADLVALDRDLETLPPQMLQDLMMHVGLPIIIISVLFLYPTYAITTKRWHDRGKSGWWSLIVLLPVIGGLWAFIELALLGGDEGDNDYGPAAY
jgi:uncharacterized membrane protein YhaH (DUF805 family)